jgi:hypothetical protein
MTSSEEKSAPPEEKKQECVVCLDADADMLANPCDHKVMCTPCSKTFALSSEKTHALKCPVCRGDITSLKSKKMIIQTVAESYIEFCQLNTQVDELKKSIETPIGVAADDVKIQAWKLELDKKQTSLSELAVDFLQTMSRTINDFIAKHSLVPLPVQTHVRSIKSRLTEIANSYNKCGLITMTECTWLRDQLQIMAGLDRYLSEKKSASQAQTMVQYNLAQLTALTESVASIRKLQK